MPLPFPLPDPLLAADVFPRGEGFYFHPAKLTAYLLLYLAWLRVVWWVGKDIRRVRLDPLKWNSLVLGCGVLGMAVVWVLPFFLLGFPLCAALALLPALVYVSKRNRRVEPEERVLTGEAMSKWFANWNRKRVAPAKKAEELPAIRFIGKSVGGLSDSPSASATVERSRGYQAALEMVHDALEQGATDIHLEPSKEEMSMRFRIDGIMTAQSPFTRQMGDAVVNIFKVLAAMDITEKRKPQDGSFSAEVANPPDVVEEGGPPSRMVDFRVSTAGSVVGEKLVMRLLDKSRQVASLTRIGMRESTRNAVKDVVAQPHGMFVVCGPTGSGKSTTLYACLGTLNRYEKNIITVEDPVEYHIDGVTQIEINTKAGKTFAGELRSILRQDPDVIYVGEIRDKETAEIACQAAQTGHMVFTTLHANDTPTAIARLIELGVPPFLVANALTAVLGQRLVRKLCPECKQAYAPNPEVVRRVGLPPERVKQFYRPPTEGEEEEADNGNRCRHCGGQGYRGRTGIFELLTVTDRMRALIRENPDINAIRQEMTKQGMKQLQEDGLRQVVEGETSIQELLRVCK